MKCPLRALCRLTNENDVVLRVELWDFNDTYVYADYESFR